MTRKPLHMTSQTRVLVRVAGICFTAAGMLIVIRLASTLVGAGPWEPTASRPEGHLVQFLLGGLIILAGVQLVRLGFLNRAVRLVDPESAGTRDAGERDGDAGVRCRDCGAVESESAKVCSRCSTPLQ